MERELSMVNKAYIRMNVKHDDLDEKVDAIQNKVRDKNWLRHKNGTFLTCTAAPERVEK